MIPLPFSSAASPYRGSMLQQYREEANSRWSCPILKAEPKLKRLLTSSLPKPFYHALFTVINVVV